MSIEDLESEIFAEDADYKRIQSSLNLARTIKRAGYCVFALGLIVMTLFVYDMWSVYIPTGYLNIWMGILAVVLCFYGATLVRVASGIEHIMERIKAISGF
jgi:hypothetical protein